MRQASIKMPGTFGVTDYSTGRPSGFLLYTHLSQDSDLSSDGRLVWAVLNSHVLNRPVQAFS